MILFTFLISMVIGVPFLVTIFALIVTIPIGFLAALGMAAFKVRNSSIFSISRSRRKIKPSQRFRLRQVIPPWNRNIRAT